MTKEYYILHKDEINFKRREYRKTHHELVLSRERARRGISGVVLTHNGHRVRMKCSILKNRNSKSSSYNHRMKEMILTVVDSIPKLSIISGVSIRVIRALLSGQISVNHGISYDKLLSIANSLGFTFSEFYEVDDVMLIDPDRKEYEDPTDEVDRLELRDRIYKVMNSCLSSQEITIIDMYFGITNGSPLSYREVGKRFNISRETARSILNMSLKKLRSTEVEMFLLK